MSNLSFYQRSIALRNQYSHNEHDADKVLILRRLVAKAFETDEQLPKSFHVRFPGFLLSQNADSLKLKISGVLHDLGYENCKVSNAYFNNSNTCFSVQIGESWEYSSLCFYKSKGFLYLHYHSTINIYYLPCYIWTFFWT